MIAMDHGAVEASFATGRNSDILMTPDFRILIGGPGTAEVKVRLGQGGDTCVDNAGAQRAVCAGFERLRRGRVPRAARTARDVSARQPARGGGSGEGAVRLPAGRRAGEQRISAGAERRAGAAAGSAPRRLGDVGHDGGDHGARWSTTRPRCAPLPAEYGAGCDSTPPAVTAPRTGEEEKAWILQSVWGEFLKRTVSGGLQSGSREQGTRLLARMDPQYSWSEPRVPARARWRGLRPALC